MKNVVLALGVVSALVAAQANAETMIADADGNGTYSLEEVTVAVPDMTAETFAEADVNGDGQLDAEELSAAKEAGLIPA